MQSRYFPKEPTANERVKQLWPKEGTLADGFAFAAAMA